MTCLPGGFGVGAAAALQPEDPFLFIRQGHDWRWLSFATAASRMAAAPVAPGDWASDPAEAILGSLRGRSWNEPRLALPASRWRDILVLDRPPAEAGALAVLDWAAATGAALVLEADRERAAGTLAWTRPTVVAGSSEELAALGVVLRRWGDAGRLRRRRAPLGRLRAVICCDSPRLDLAAPWSELGVPVLAVP